MLQTKGPHWDVETGRRDGNVSLISDPINPVTGLPPPFLNITSLKQSFALRGLNTKDLVVLSGTIFYKFTNCYVLYVVKRDVTITLTKIMKKILTK